MNEKKPETTANEFTVNMTVPSNLHVFTNCLGVPGVFWCLCDADVSEHWGSYYWIRSRGLLLLGGIPVNPNVSMKGHCSHWAAARSERPRG